MVLEIIKRNSVRHGKRLYKQMSLEVATRNPERLFSLIKIFDKYDGIVLSDDTILDIFSQLYIEEFLSDENINIFSMNKEEIKEYIKQNKTHNNEWGFPTGYQAAFSRYLKTLSEFGFIYSQYNQTFKISNVGKALCNGEIEPSEAFAIQSLRFWRKSPYRRVLNDFNFFTFIYNVLIKLKEKNKKLSYTQFMVALFSDNGNVDEFINIIENNKFGTSFDLAYQYVYRNYHLRDEEHGKVSKMISAFRDYGNTVFRMLQFTGFITVDSVGGVMLLSINSNRLDFLKDLYQFDFSLSEEIKEDEYLYFQKLGSFDERIHNVIKLHRPKEDYSTADYNKKMPNILKTYGLSKEDIVNYLRDVSNGRKDNKVFWFISDPIKYEFLLTLYVYSCYGDEFEYKPNFKCDDNGIPYSHAPGNIGDIEIFNKNLYWLLEATLIRNKTQQLNSETVNLVRHIDEATNREKYLELVAPFIHEDTKVMLRLANLISMIEKKGLKLYSKATPIEDFIKNTSEKLNVVKIKEYSKNTFAEIKTLLDEYVV